MQNILNWLAQADDDQISQVITAIISRYGEAHPDWEIFFLSLPKNDPIERRYCIAAATAMLLRETEENQ